MRFRLDSSLTDDAGWTTPATEATLVLRGWATGASLLQHGRELRTWREPLAALDWLDATRREGGRWVGYFAYELGHLLEPATRGSAVGLDVPLFLWGQSPHHSTQAAPPTPSGTWSSPIDDEPAPAGSSLSREQYLHCVERCIEYILAGDVYQVNLSQRLSLPFRQAPGDLYRLLLATAPAAYGGFLEVGDLAIVSNSPELFLRVSPEGQIVTRPVKGTRPRGPGMREALLASEKDAAELNMIVDLERNDLGRVCEIGSVRVTENRAIETHPTVHHGVATVAGQLRREVGLVDLLRATFPGGSITGAPKIRAMQIIRELEPVQRGAYCGAIGHLDADGSLQLNVAIRTATLDRRLETLYVPVGGGIVAESDPSAEYEETLVKARPLLRAAAGVGIGATAL